jgi:arginine/lysine/ornithine decarboxylase
LSEALDQSRAPILEALQKFVDNGVTQFTTPGHKSGRSIDEYTASVLGQSTFARDIPELTGVEDRHMTVEVTQEAQDLAAQVHHADGVMFSSNGSSLSVHVALMTIANRGDKVIFARNFHRSVAAAIILTEVTPVWLQPPVDTEMNVQHGPTVESVREIIAKHPDAKALMLTSPDYYGFTSDIRGIAEVCHEHDVVLMVDAAWGPHFPFHPELPASEMECGADIAVGSIHKTLNGLQQASILKYAGPRVDPNRAKLAFGLYESTSASMLVFGSIDGDRRLMAMRGEELWGNALRQSRRIRASLAGIQGIRAVGREVLERPGVFDQDETKLVLDFSGLGITGVQAADFLATECRITVELAEQRHIMALITAADDDRTADRLIEGLRLLASWATEHGGTPPPAGVPPLADLQTEVVLSPRDAMFGRVRSVPLEDAPGQIIAECVSPYPPGIPLLIPGERITPPMIDFIHAIQDMRIPVPDTVDSSLKTLRVVA